MTETNDEHYVSGEAHHDMHTKVTRPPKKITIQTARLGTITAAVALCGISFGSGIIYQKHHASVTPNTAAATNSGNSTGPARGRRFGGGNRRLGAFGSVTAVSGTSITITNQRTNASSTYTIASSTVITDNGQTVTASNIQTGDTVLIRTNTTDTSTATRIDVNPSFGSFGGGTSAPLPPSTPDSRDTTTPPQTN